MVRETKLYQILGVETNATTEEISSAYKKMAKLKHPDKNPDDPNASKNFEEINEAKEILLNPEKRQLYDQLGMDGLKQGGGGQPGNAEDLFNMFGGFGGFGMPGRGGGGQQKENINVQETVTLEKIYNEEHIPVNYKQKILCGKCSGEGTKDGSTSKCGICGGVGVVTQVIRMGPMIQQMQQACNACKGSGKLVKPENNCNDCNGEGHKTREVRVNIPLKCGLSEGQQIQLPNQGHHLKDGKTDLLITIHVTDHPVFKRSGDDLHIEIELKLFQAVFGFEKIIEHLDKRKIYVSYTGKTEYGQVKKIVGEGMKSLNSGNKGDLYITFTYNLPDVSNVELNQKLQVLLKSIDQSESNKEVDIRMNKSSYQNANLINVDKQAQQQQQQQHHHGPRVQVEGQQCAHQ